MLGRCIVHGDMPKSADIMLSVRQALNESGWTVYS